jgi:hypothetical protein
MTILSKMMPAEVKSEKQRWNESRQSREEALYSHEKSWNLELQRMALTLSSLKIELAPCPDLISQRRISEVMKLPINGLNAFGTSELD